MTVHGFHASHEQVHPARLLDAVVHAREQGEFIDLSGAKGLPQLRDSGY